MFYSNYEEDGRYSYWRLAGVPTQFRDPGVPAGGGYFSVLGGAQAFGRHLDEEETFVAQTGASLAVPGVNLGVGGVGPGFYVKYPNTLDIVNQGWFCVIVVMSGRSQLLAGIKIPRYLVWMSHRTPSYEPSLKHPKKWHGSFPHFVNQKMVDRLRANCDGFVSVVSTETVGPEKYYSGVEMNRRVAEGLADVIGRDRSSLNL